MTAIVKAADPDAPLIIAFHGAGQTVRPYRWWQSPYLNFPRMSGLLAECESRGWGCWMPQAPLRVWGDVSATDVWADDWIGRAQEATGTNSRPIVMGFSDGAYLAAELLAMGVDAAAWVLYSPSQRGGVDGLRFGGAAPLQRVCVLWNQGEAARIRRQADQVRRMLEQESRLRNSAALEVHHMVAASWWHRWDRSINERVFEWLALTVEA